MTTQWKWRLYFYIRKVDASAELKTEFAEILVNNGSMETIPDEEKAFDDPLKYSSDGELPAVVLGISLPVKQSMRSDLVVLLDSLTNARYAATANTKLDNYEDRELILTTFDVVPNGQIIDQDGIDNYLNNEFGLIRIAEED